MNAMMQHNRPSTTAARRATVRTSLAGLDSSQLTMVATVIGGLASGKVTAEELEGLSPTDAFALVTSR